MKADFSGWATKAGLKCSDGRTIMAHAFEKQHNARVPLVWQHGHSDVKNVLGHAILENRDEGVYAYGFFNDSPEAQHAAGLVEHGDINMMSIWANQLIERSANVLHGVIREVSLVLSGANPGALIESVTIQHDDGGSTELEDEAIITTGLLLEHTAVDDKIGDEDTVEELDEEEELMHEDEDGETVKDVYDTLSDKQKQVVHYMIGEALSGATDGEGEVKQSEEDGESHSSEDIDEDHANHGATDTNDPEGNEMKHNVFENNGEGSEPVISHEALGTIVKTAQRSGSLRDAFEGYALEHGINDIDILFPDAQAVQNTPEFLSRRTEWVGGLLSGVRKSPFSRVKTLMADITMDEARAKGYVTGAMKKEEFFTVSKRVTTPTTIYKKQKLDRDDMIDITDFDVVAWLKAEMRVMLDEEIARAILVGDGRDISSEDKIPESNIRPIATDHELYTSKVYVNVDDASSSVQEVIDAIVLNRRHLKGSGQPTMYTTETLIAQFLLLKDTTGRRIYKNLDEVAGELRVSRIVPVEVMEEDPTLLAVIVNPTDYVAGADKGGQVSMFDDFDIDYNQNKYLIETRMSGALVKLKAAQAVWAVGASDVLVAPAEPAFDAAAGTLTITDQTGVVYTDGDDVTINAAGSPYSVASGESIVVNAAPDSGYYFASSEDDMWIYTAD